MKSSTPVLKLAIERLPMWTLSTLSAVLMVMAIGLALPSKAFGYADPGTGAFVYQAVYAGFLAGAFYLRKILNRISGKKKKDSTNPTPGTANPVA